MNAADYKRITERLDTEITAVEGVSATRWTPAMAATQALTHFDDWPEPLPLTAKIEFEPYPIDSLPSVIRHAVSEVVGFVKAPEAMVAMSATQHRHQLGCRSTAAVCIPAQLTTATVVQLYSTRG